MEGRRIFTSANRKGEGGCCRAGSRTRLAETLPIEDPNACLFPGKHPCQETQTEPTGAADKPFGKRQGKSFGNSASGSHKPIGMAHFVSTTTQRELRRQTCTIRLGRLAARTLHSPISGVSLSDATRLGNTMGKARTLKRINSMLFSANTSSPQPPGRHLVSLSHRRASAACPGPFGLSRHIVYGERR